MENHYVVQEYIQYEKDNVQQKMSRDEVRNSFRRDLSSYKTRNEHCQPSIFGFL
jgi:hypothetical protein